MSTILPKGIVVNHPGVGRDIEKIDREPLAPEEIAKLWKVYTTTQRRLLDPTAERLENYWWRIWGSRQRKLRGATVARLFSEISDGRSFVPLRGPPNRDESGGRQIPRSPRGHLQAVKAPVRSKTGGETSPASVAKDTPPMPPPILKKNRGPSTTGPRPTARFISPNTTEDEDDSGASSGQAQKAQVVVRPPTPDGQVQDKGKGRATATPSISVESPGEPRRRRIPPPEPMRRTNSDITYKEPTAQADVDPVEHNKTLLDGRLGRNAERPRGPDSLSPRTSTHAQRVVQTTSRPADAAETVRSALTPTKPTSDNEPDGVLSPRGNRPQVPPRSPVSPRKASDPKRMDLKSSTAPTVTHQNAARRDRDSSSSNIDAWTMPSLGDDVADATGAGQATSATVTQQGGAGMFAKRPIQPVKSSSALFSSTAPQASGSGLSRSKSQLTMLLEKDRENSQKNQKGKDAESGKSPKGKGKGKDKDTQK